MNFDGLLDRVTDKRTFNTLQGYIDFTASFLEFTQDNLQARIVSRNEPHYQFLQYGAYASYLHDCGNPQSTLVHHVRRGVRWTPSPTCSTTR